MTQENRRWLHTTLSFIAEEALERGIVPPWLSTVETILQLAVELEADQEEIAELEIG